MMPKSHFLALAILLASGAVRADGTVPVPLNEPSERITDEAIWADYTVLDGLEQRLKALNEKGGVSTHDYFYAKAQAWLDFSREEYAENDRSRVVEESANQAQGLIEGMEQGLTDRSMETPLVAGSTRVREDLWQRAAEMKQHPGFPCAAYLIAEYEVQLVNAGHDEWEMGWRHALSNVRTAERLVRDAELALAQCEQPKPAAAPMDSLVETTDRFVTYSDYDIDDPNSDSGRELGRLIEFISGMERVRQIRVSGHTDRMGSDEYNFALSQRRAEKVKALLIQRGVAAEVIIAEGFGRRRPVTTCDERDFKRAADLKSCLQPNRRVEIEVDSRKRITQPAPQGQDVPAVQRQ